jgi:hypothetical protein
MAADRLAQRVVCPQVPLPVPAMLLYSPLYFCDGFRYLLRFIQKAAPV